MPISDDFSSGDGAMDLVKPGRSSFDYFLDTPVPEWIKFG